MKRAARTTAIRVSEDIVPIAEFKAHLSEVVRGLPARRRAVVITQNGKPAAVVLSPAAFDQLAYQSRFIAAINEGLEDADAGRLVSDLELSRFLDDRYGRLPAKRRAKSR